MNRMSGNTTSTPCSAPERWFGENRFLTRSPGNDQGNAQHFDDDPHTPSGQSGILIERIAKKIPAVTPITTNKRRVMFPFSRRQVSARKEVRLLPRRASAAGSGYVKMFAEKIYKR
jgi:hypothetical protein